MLESPREGCHRLTWWLSVMEYPLTAHQSPRSLIQLSICSQRLCQEAGQSELPGDWGQALWEEKPLTEEQLL